MASTSSLLSQAPVALEGQHWCSLGRGDRGQEAAGCGGQQLSSSLRKGSESLEHSGQPPLLTCSLWLLLNVSRAHSRSWHYKFAFFILCLTWLDGKMHILKNSPQRHFLYDEKTLMYYMVSDSWPQNPTKFLHILFGVAQPGFQLLQAVLIRIWQSVHGIFLILPKLEFVLLFRCLQFYRRSLIQINALRSTLQCLLIAF